MFISLLPTYPQTNAVFIRAFFSGFNYSKWPYTMLLSLDGNSEHVAHV